MHNNLLEKQMNADEVKLALKTEIEPLVLNILSADQSYYLLKTSGGFSDGINFANFGNLFVFLQSILSDKFILNVAKIFENSKRYRIHSIPVVIDLLEEHCAVLNIYQKPNFLRVLKESGLRDSTLEELSDKELTRKVVNHFNSTLPDIHKKDDCDLSRALDSVKSIRDKRIAHNEKVKATDLPKMTWVELNKLLDYAKSFIGAIGWGYLSTAYEVNGEYIRSRDAKYISNAMRRLLEEASISIKNERGSRDALNPQ